LKTEIVLAGVLSAALIAAAPAAAVVRAPDGLVVHPEPGTRQTLIEPATFRGPAADSHAHRVGDLLTVHVLETTRARSQASTGNERKTRFGASVTGPTTNYDSSFDIEHGGHGVGETTRIGELRAQITVRVTQVEDNGAMHIQGQTSLRVNGENQGIEVTGVVRPEDISSDNVVVSSRIAYAQIALSGKGVVSQSQRRSLLATVMTWMGL
jgi:flagellar L-ring protein precursor FlgH